MASVQNSTKYNDIFVDRLPYYCSISSCEKFAILRGLMLIHDSDEVQFKFLTDSANTIQFLKNTDQYDYLIQRIQEFLQFINLDTISRENS